MISIKVRKGYKLNITGKPSLETDTLEKPEYVAVLPEKIPFIKPRLKVSIGDKVRTGSILFEDKRNTDIRFLSPGTGEIARINFGPRRVIENIVIQLDDTESFESFEAMLDKEPEQIDREKLIRMLLDGGLWHLIKEFPFQDIARPDTVPPAIFVSLGAEEPFQPAPEVYLDGKKELFEYGIRVLRRLTTHVHVYAPCSNAFVLENFQDMITHTYEGAYPADDPGVLLYHIRTSSSENRSWHIKGQDVLLLAHFLKTGTYPTERVVVVAGSSVKEKKHVRTRLGVPIAHLTRHLIQNNGANRYIAGGIFRGYQTSDKDYLGFYETSVIALPEGRQKEFFGFVRPGAGKNSYSRAFLSVLNSSPLKADCNLHGDERACVNCGTCAKVCPVDIFPQFTFKCILADEIEESLAHGMLDCVECGLCSHVCPSKIEICNIIKTAKALYYKEM